MSECAECLRRALRSVWSDVETWSEGGYFVFVRDGEIRIWEFHDMIGQIAALDIERKAPDAIIDTCGG